MNERLFFAALQSFQFTLIITKATKTPSHSAAASNPSTPLLYLSYATHLCTILTYSLVPKPHINDKKYLIATKVAVRKY